MKGSFEKKYPNVAGWVVDGWVEIVHVTGQGLSGSLVFEGITYLIKNSMLGKIKKYFLLDQTHPYGS